MRMIPDTAYASANSAEKRVFDRLRAACNHPGDHEWVCYHSLNLTRHAYKRFGEIDFLICGREGLFVLEVKGGDLCCNQGVWTYGKRSSHESPFRQAETALHGLMANLREHLPEDIIEQFTIGFGVIFTDCAWLAKGAEWDRRTLADAREFRDIEPWLRRLIRYWRGKVNRPVYADSGSLTALRRYLRPSFEAVVPLHVLADQAEEQAVHLTDDQMVMVDVVSANPRALCSGGAGTGKTFLALELARRWTAMGKQVLLACKSPWLRRYLETRFAVPNLTVALVDNVLTIARRADIQHFDALILDEGQDLFDMESLDRLDGILKGGLARGDWCIFHDVNHQSGLVGRADPLAFQYLQGLRPIQVPLRTNCRNTRFILERVQQATGADMGIRGIGAGPEVRCFLASTPEESATRLALEIKEIVDEGGLAPGHLTILSPRVFDASSAALLPENIRRTITLLDEFSLRSFPPAQVSFTRIANFKGLENEAVIVVDLPEPGGKPGEDLTQHYVAMSRPRAVLSTIFFRTFEPAHDPYLTPLPSSATLLSVD